MTHLLAGDSSKVRTMLLRLASYSLAAELSGGVVARMSWSGKIGKLAMLSSPRTDIMATFPLRSALVAIFLGVLLAPLAAGQETRDPKKSYYYYGKYAYYDPEPFAPRRPPISLVKWWHADAKVSPNAEAQRLGRDTWIHWTWGNQKVIRQAAVLAGNLPVPVSVDLFRLLDSRNRYTRFRDLGLINEPNCEKNAEKDKYELYLDTFKGDPLGYYPVSDEGREVHPDWFPPPDEKVRRFFPLHYSRGDGRSRQYGAEQDTRNYGWPSGVIGLRLFKNPQFDKDKWNVNEYFKNPGKVEPPYLVGFTCAICHIAFNPLNPPKDPERPEWENLAANIGNQYFREGELMLGKGRVVFGDKNADKDAPNDPYKNRGLMDSDFLYHYAATQQPGTSETSRITYDFINNPNTINPIFGLKSRPTYTEITPWGKERSGVFHVLKDGADSLGLEWALMRVPINIGCEGSYLVDHLFLPGIARQRPFRIAEVLAGLQGTEDGKAVENSLGLSLSGVSELRQAELKMRYRSPYNRPGEEFGQDWQETWRRTSSLGAYLVSYGPAHLADLPSPPPEVDFKKSPDLESARMRGAKVFDTACSRCHSFRRPQDLVAYKRADFLDGNFLSNDKRISVTDPGDVIGPNDKRDPPLGTNLARALATNAVDHDIWAEFSSKNYKALPPIQPVTLQAPVFPPSPWDWKALQREIGPGKQPVPVFPQGTPQLPWSLRKPIRIDFEPPGGGRGYYRTPSLISMWATAPYLHNNSVGDYWVWINEESVQFPNDGRPIGFRQPDGTWENYRIDVTVQGRLKMFEDGIRKLLYPEKRRHWVKRTWIDSSFIPDLAASAWQLIMSIARDVLRHELRRWLVDNGVVPEIADQAADEIESSLHRAALSVLPDAKADFESALKTAHGRASELAGRVFDLMFDDLKATLEKKLKDRFHLDKLDLGDKLKASLRKEFLGRVDRLHQELLKATLLKVRAGTPVNLYANLSPTMVPYAILKHIRLRDDPQALAEALLRMSDCPDLVEDSGHIYGADLSDQEKEDLIVFLRTF
jgi:hypothetical protein